MNDTPSDDDAVEDTVGLALQRCPACNHPIDDVSKMSQSEVLEGLQDALLRDLLRAVRTGDATHQELAIARGVLRDQNMMVPGDDPEREAPKRGPGGRRRGPPSPREDYSWENSPDYGETEGG